jgi:hypothetical protein
MDKRQNERHVNGNTSHQEDNKTPTQSRVMEKMKTGEPVPG